jgi:acetyl esterase/lipase
VAKLRFLLGLILNMVRVKLGSARLRPTWTVTYEAIVRTLRATFAHAQALELPARRAYLDALALPSFGGGAAPDVTILKVLTGGVSAMWVTPKGTAVGVTRALVYFHGGGYQLGSFRTYADLLARLAARANMRVLFVDYRLAPDFPHPAALEDALASVRWLRENGNTSLVFAGDGAGAHLALATMLELRDLGEPLPLRAALLSPWVDVGSEGSLKNYEIDTILPGVPGDWLRGYQSGRKAPRASPLQSDLRGLPPILLQTGDAEVFHDDAVLLGKKANADGVKGQVTVYKDMVSGWHLFAPLGVPEAAVAIDEAGAVLAEAPAPAAVRTSVPAPRM